jgi:hypothetical protein
LITVFIPANFIPERTYAVNTLLNHYAGYPVNIVPRAGQLHYELSWEDKRVIIRDQFFGKTYVGESYLRYNRIPVKIVSTTTEGLDNILMFYGEEQIEISTSKIDSAVDLFAGAFFMLTRWEESFGTYEDKHGRFPADKSLVVREGYILRPVVDEYVALLKKWITALGYPEPASRHEFKVVPTCDIDIPFYWRSRPGWRLLAGRFIKHKSFRQLRQDYELMRSMKKGNQKDPYDTFDYLMTLAESKGLTFLFHMLAGGETVFEGYYDIRDPRIITLMNEIRNRGHQIGLHPSYNSFNDPLKIDKERRDVEKYSGIHVKASRQHYLRFAVPETWRHLHRAYIKEDSTLGYAAEPGFRCGTSRPFPVFDIHQQKELPLIERPLLIMDVSLKLYKQFSIEESKAYCKTIVDQVKKHNGELVILWHNSSLSELDGWDAWNEVLEFLTDSDRG